jgi:hypothetical protein
MRVVLVGNSVVKHQEAIWRLHYLVPGVLPDQVRAEHIVSQIPVHHVVADHSRVKSPVLRKSWIYQIGTAGEGWTPSPQPSYIQVLTVDQDWNENTLTWNNAPPAAENITGTWVNPLPAFPGWPGLPRQWDVSRAATQAYAAGRSLRLVVYSADSPYHTGRYFTSSDIEDWDEVGRPTLTVTWGEPGQ